MSRGLPTLILVTCLRSPGAGAQQPVPLRGYLADSTLTFLAAMIGEWKPVLHDTLLRRLGFQPIAENYQWVVGRRAIRIQENYPTGSADRALLEGLVWWNPATEKVESAAVAGPGDGEGRLYRGEYRLADDGAIVREWDVYYRSLADTPGERFGGSRRRYREAFFPISPDTMRTTLEWWHDGVWRPYGPFARGVHVRWRP